MFLPPNFSTCISLGSGSAGLGLNQLMYSSARSARGRDRITEDIDFAFSIFPESLYMATERATTGLNGEFKAQPEIGACLG